VQDLQANFEGVKKGPEQHSVLHEFHARRFARRGGGDVQTPGGCCLSRTRFRVAGRLPRLIRTRHELDPHNVT